MGIFSIIRLFLCLTVAVITGVVGYHYGYRDQAPVYNATKDSWSPRYELKIIKLGPSVNGYVTDQDSGSQIAARLRLNRVQLTSPQGNVLLLKKPMAFTADKKVGYTKHVQRNLKTGIIVPADLVPGEDSPRLFGFIAGVLASVFGFAFAYFALGILATPRGQAVLGAN